MKRRIVRVLCTTFMLAALVMSNLAMAEATPYCAVNVSVKGNSDIFKVDMEADVKLKMADSIIRRVVSVDDRCIVADEYRTPQALQHLYDEIVAAEVVPFQKKLSKTLRDWEGAYEPYAYGALSLTCESPLGSSLGTGKPTSTMTEGQGYAHVRLSPIDGAVVGLGSNLLHLQIYTLTKHGKGGGTAYIRSEALYNLVIKMSAPQYALNDLARAERVTWGLHDMNSFSGPDDAIFSNTETSINGHVTQDTMAIAQLNGVFQAGVELSDHLRVYQRALMRFTLPDGQNLYASLCTPSSDDALVDWQGHIFLMTNTALYDLDPSALKDALVAAGLLVLPEKLFD